MAKKPADDNGGFTGPPHASEDNFVLTSTPSVKDTRHLTNRKTWLQCAALLEKTLDSFPVEVATMALEFVVRARKPDFIPSDQQ